ncbi:Hypothetical predicted protein [Olea europaea subsp. europaea]|uniref:Uncharacterized protein n=1 Tax=Olea europaea subsp. europaea TaxID=158383 RepID=A0A8S0UNA5_OLEEU|nr:Hypothetical predicted protein [Olea europaea subsp. europaea]
MSKTQLQIESSDEDVVIPVHSEDSGGEWQEDRPATPVPEPDSFLPLDRTPKEEEYVLTACPGKKGDLFYVAKVIKELDDDGDLEISYLRKSNKTRGKFVIPNVPEMCSIPLADVRMILPPPSCSGTKRQKSL